MEIFTGWKKMRLLKERWILFPNDNVFCCCLQFQLLVFSCDVNVQIRKTFIFSFFLLNNPKAPQRWRHFKGPTIFFGGWIFVSQVLIIFLSDNPQSQAKINKKLAHKLKCFTDLQFWTNTDTDSDSFLQISPNRFWKISWNTSRLQQKSWLFTIPFGCQMLPWLALA